MVDVGDELVCRMCGLVSPKEVSECFEFSPGPLRPTSKEELGSYMGSAGITPKERASKGLSGSNSRYEYLKTLSDFAGREEGPVEASNRMTERVGEKLYLPRFVVDQARWIAKVLLNSRHRGRRISIAAVSAYALISACKVEKVASVSVKEIMEAHVAMGRGVSASSVFRLTLESPVKTFARTPEDYLSRVLAKLSTNEGLSRRLKSEGECETTFFNSLRETAKELLVLADRESMEGRRPCALAASAVYSAELFLARQGLRKKRLTQKEVACCGDTAEYTIREQCARIFTPAVRRAVARRMQVPLPAQGH